MFLIGCSDGVKTLPEVPVGFAGSIFQEGVSVTLVEGAENPDGFYTGSTLNLVAEVPKVGLAFKLVFLHSDGDVSGFMKSVVDNNFPLDELFGDLAAQYDALFTFIDPGALLGYGGHPTVYGEIEIPKFFEVPDGDAVQLVDVLTGEYILAIAFNELDLNTGQYTDWNWYYTTINILGKDYCETLVEGNKFCLDDTSTLCHQNRLSHIEDCEFGCFDGSGGCKEGNPGDIRCIAIDSALQKANDDGFYEEIETCGFNGASAPLCFLAEGDTDAACHSCVPDDTMCEGDDRLVCGADGEFAVEETCEAGTCLASDSSECKECVPGSQVCATQDADGNVVTDILLQCNDDGEYVANQCGIKCLSTNVCLGPPTELPSAGEFDIPSIN
tara:strand:+ start:1163 stop:2317 length:1155 start_codon:yes stop_codon:yes gene_type:complete